MSRMLTVALAFLTLFLVGCGDNGGGGGASSALPGAESPEALVAKARTLVEGDEFGGIVNLIAPDERPLMSVGMIMLSKMMPMMMGGMGAGLGGDAAKAEIAKKMKPFEDSMAGVMKKHGLDKLDMEAAGASMMSGSPEDAGKWMNEQAPGLDHGAFVGDVLTALSGLGDDASGRATKSFEKLSGELTDVKIDGDMATGKIGDQPGEFRKVDGRWYFSIKNRMGR